MSAAGRSSASDGMVWVQGGTFVMGSDRHYPEEAPAHPVTVGGFWIDTCPVTNAEFARFVRKTGHVTVAETAAPEDYSWLAALPRYLTVAVGEHRVGIVHGDPENLELHEPTACTGAILTATETGSGRIPGASGCSKASSRITTGQRDIST
jgi:hypothetical protein